MLMLSGPRLTSPTNPLTRGVTFSPL